MSTTLNNLRTAAWRKPENDSLCYGVCFIAVELKDRADRGVVGANRAAELAAKLTELLGGWPDDARAWLCDYRPEIESLLRAKTPAELHEEN